MPNTKRPSRLLISCARGPAELRAVLHLPNPPSARSTLELKLGGGLTCEVSLAPRYTLVIRELAAAREQDEEEVESQRGFRTKAELCGRVSNPSNKNPVEETTVSQYVREIRAEIKAAIKAAIESLRLPEGSETRIPKLIESKRGSGYRIGPCGLDIREPRPRQPRARQPRPTQPGERQTVSV